MAPGERVLVVAHPDPESSQVAWAVHDSVVQAGGEPVLVATQPRRGAQLADPVLVRALETDPDVVVLFTTGRLGGDPERLSRPIHSRYTHYLQYLLSEAPTRGFWSHGVTRGTFIRGVSVDHGAMREAGRRLAARLEDAVELRISSGGGDELVLPLEAAPARLETGDYREPGSTGELPAGELVASVRPGAAAGRLTVSGGVALPEERIAAGELLRVDVEAGRVVGVAGAEAAKRLQGALAGGRRMADAAVREGWLTREEADRFGQGTDRVREVALGLNSGLKPRGGPGVEAKAEGVVRLVVGAGLREHPPGAPVSLELVVTAARVVAVDGHAQESVLLERGRLVAAPAGA